MRYWKVARARKQSGAALKRGRGRRRKGKKAKKREKKKEREKEREEKKIVSRVHVGCSAPFIRHMSRRDIERPTRKRGRERERKRGGRFRSRRPSRFTEIQNNGSVPFRQSPVTRSSRDRIAGGGNFLASTPWRRREVGEVCWWWDDDNVERGKETYPRDDTSGRVRGQASTLELVLRTGGTSLLCGQKEGA